METAMQCEDPIIITDTSPPFEIVAVNEAWTRLCGFAADEAVGKTPKILQSEATDKSAARAFAAGLHTTGKATTTLVNVDKQGCQFQHELNGHTVYNNGKTCFVVQSSGVVRLHRFAREAPWTHAFIAFFVALFAICMLFNEYRQPISTAALAPAASTARFPWVAVAKQACIQTGRIARRTVPFASIGALANLDLLFVGGLGGAALASGM